MDALKNRQRMVLLMTAPKASATAPAQAPAPAKAAKTGTREERLRGDIKRLQQGGPEKYRAKLADEGKLFVRDRLSLFFPEGLAFEDGLFANNLRAEEGLAADGMVTGAAKMEDRTVFVIANDYTVKAGSMAERGTSSTPRAPASRTRRASSPTSAASGNTSTTTASCRGRSRRSPCCTDPASRARPTRRSSATSWSWCVA
jgi:hypothetical protein